MRASLSYDGNGNLLSVTDPRTKTTSYTYNNMDKRAGRTDPLLRAESFQYDVAGNLTTSLPRQLLYTTVTR